MKTTEPEVFTEEWFNERNEEMKEQEEKVNDMKTTKVNQEVLQHGIDNLEGISADSVWGCDLHHELYNMNYFITRTSEARIFLQKIGTFQAINRVQEYEKNMFGQCITDLGDAEKVANMYAYIEGEEILSEIEALREKWDDLLTEEDLIAIKEELEELV